MFYCLYQTGEGWFAIAYNRVVPFSMSENGLKHKLASKWEFLPDNKIRCRVTGQAFNYRIEKVDV